MRTLLPFNPFTRSLEAVIGFFTIVCGWWLIALSAMTCVEMLGRKVLGFSLQGVDEIGSYTFAAVGAFGFSYTLITRGHTRVDFLVSRFSEKTRALLNFIAMITLAAMGAFFAFRAYHVLAESISLGSTAATPLATPLWIPQSIWLAAYIIFAVAALVAAWYACALLAASAWKELNKRYGPQTLEEEIEAETPVHVDQHIPFHEAAKP
jgi:TRAP-type C4-dicarboxylate transport system permease small subunit